MWYARIYVCCSGNVYDVLCVIGLEDIPTCNTATCPYVHMCFIKSFWPMSNTCGGSNYNEHTSRGYLCFPALSGVAFCFFSGMTKKLLILRVLFLTANNGTLPVAGAIMGTCGETVYGDADNQKRSRGKSLVKMVTALFQVTSRYSPYSHRTYTLRYSAHCHTHSHPHKCLSRMECYINELLTTIA